MYTELITAPARPGQLQAQAFTGDLFSRFIDYTDRKDTTIKGYLTCIRQFGHTAAFPGGRKSL